MQLKVSTRACSLPDVNLCDFGMHLTTLTNFLNKDRQDPDI